MAVVCPKCEQIHFETNRSALPTHCGGCGHDLSEPVSPLPATPPTNAEKNPRPGVDQPYLLAGFAVLSLAGWFLLTGLAEREKYVPVRATMTVGYLDWAPAKGGVLFRDSESGDGGNAYYTVDGQKYRTTVNRRWRLGDEFEVWYLPEAPDTAVETRPFVQLLVATGLMAVGLFLFGRGFGLYGAAIEPPVERVALAVPTAAETEAVHSPPSFAADDVRLRR